MQCAKKNLVMSKFIQLPDWQLTKSQNRNRPEFWAAETVMGTVCIFQNTEGLYYINADFIHYPDNENRNIGLSTILTKDPRLGRFSSKGDCEALKEQINAIHLEQIRKFIQFSKIIT